jgi:hypothetical protein
MIPPRLSTDSSVSLTCAGMTFHASGIATSASGNVRRKTDPHEKCSSRKPAHTGPSALIAAPRPDHSAIDFVRRGPDHSAVISASVVG